MKKSILSTLLVAAALPFAASAVEVDGITATVGQTSILRSEVLELMRSRGETDLSRFNTYRDELVERTLVLKAAKDSKVTMQDWVVKDRVQTIINESFEGDRNKLVQMLARERVSMSDWERRIREDLIIKAMRWNAVYKNVRVSPAEMQAEYKEHPERYRAEQKVTLSIILLKPEDLERRADVTEAIKTESFAAAARMYSADPHAKEGGVWKDINPAGIFKPEIGEEIARMPKGTISDWIDVRGWSFLLRKEDESYPRTLTFAEAYDDIEAHVREANAKRLSNAWIERLKANTYIRIY